MEFNLPNIDEIENIFRKVLKEHLSPILSQFSEELDNSDGPTYLTRKDVGELLKVSLPTVDKYTREGVLKRYKIGGRYRYKLSEIVAIIEDIK